MASSPGSSNWARSIVTGVEPMTAVIPNKLRLRDDVVTDGDVREKVLGQCASARRQLFWRAEGD